MSAGLAHNISDAALVRKTLSPLEVTAFHVQKERKKLCLVYCILVSVRKRKRLCLYGN